jgi:O-antigen/teichoic acid export membrane protein
MQTRRFLHSSSLYLISNLANRAVGFLMLPVYSRCLTPGEYGVVELIELTIQVAALILGVQSVGGAMIRIFHDSDDPRWRSGVVSTALIGGLALNVLLAMAGFAAAGPISAYILHDPRAEPLVRMSAVAMVLVNLVEVNLIYLRLLDRVERCVVYSLVQLLVAVGLNVLFLVYFEMGIFGLLVGKLITFALGAGYLMWHTLRDVGIRWNAAAARKMFSFGSPLVLSNMAFFAIHFGDRWILGALHSIEEVGRYALAYRFAFVISLLVGEPFGKVWNVSLYNYTSEPDWKAKFGRVARYLTFALCLTGLGLAVFGGEIIRRMAAPSYHAGAAVLPILILAYVAREMGDFFRNVLYINKQSRLVGRIALAAAVLNTALNLTLIGPLGMYGAAYATLAAWSLYLGLCWAAARREHEIPFTIGSFATALLAGAAIFLAATAMPKLSPVLHLGIQTVMVMQFIAILWLLSYFPAQERCYIKSKLSVAFSDLGGWFRQRVAG